MKAGRIFRLANRALPASNKLPEIAVEYLLGAIAAIDQRVARQRANQRSLLLRETARALAKRVEKVFLRRGWYVDWSPSPVAPIMSRTPPPLVII
jgi:hypothetical protein